MKVNKIFIFTSEPFPMGMAGTNRIISYAKGFLYHKKDVEVVCFRKTDVPGDVKNTNTTGVFEGVKFRYITSSTVKSTNFVSRRLDDILSYIKLFFLALTKVNRYTMSIYYSSHTIPVIILKIIHQIRGGVLLKEENEHPLIRIRLKNTIEKTLFQRLHYRLFDGFFLITETLIEYFKISSSGKKPMLHVPMMIDFERFTGKKIVGPETKEIVYCGELSFVKDGIDILLKAFKKISEQHDEYILSFYGRARPSELIGDINSLVNELNLDHKVFFHGQVDRDTITEKIMKATILVLPRPDSIQARHGFSTKLGEYLATGNPVLATSVGEIPNYLTDHENVFFAIPGDVRSLEEKLLFIIENYKLAMKIAHNGREFAENHFSNIKHTKRVLSFVESSF